MGPAAGPDGEEEEGADAKKEATNWWLLAEDCWHYIAGAVISVLALAAWR